MAKSILFVHDWFPATGLHVITSPDIKGFHVTGETHDETEDAALRVLWFLIKRGLLTREGRVAAVERATAAHA